MKFILLTIAFYDILKLLHTSLHCLKTIQICPPVCKMGTDGQFRIITREEIIMAAGKRIRFFRNLRGLKQKELGTALGFSPSTAEARIAQYETELRLPRKELLTKIASILGVRTEAINVPDIDTMIGFMHTLFALEDMYGIKIGEIDGEVCLRLDRTDGPTFARNLDLFLPWLRQMKKLEKGEITKEDYDWWRYNYPEGEIVKPTLKPLKPSGNTDNSSSNEE